MFYARLFLTRKKIELGRIIIIMRYYGILRMLSCWYHSNQKTPRILSSRRNTSWRVCIQLNWHMFFVVLKESFYRQNCNGTLFFRVLSSKHILIIEKPVYGLDRTTHVSKRTKHVNVSWMLNKDQARQSTFVVLIDMCVPIKVFDCLSMRDFYFDFVKQS